MPYKNKEKRKEYNREYRLKNKEKLALGFREWKEKNKEQQKNYHCEYHKKWYLEHKEERQKQIKKYSQNHKADNVRRVQKYVFNNKNKVLSYRKRFEQSVEGKYRQLLWRAKHFSGAPINLKEFQELFSSPCVYCGFAEKVGIDRIDNSKGYTLENSAPCCKTCNFMKKAMIKEDFLEHIKKIYKYNFR